MVRRRAPADPDGFGLPPLLGVDYQATPLGGRNGAVAGQPVTVDLSVARQEGAEPSGVVAAALWLSTDDERSWRRMRLGKAGPGHYQAVIPRSRLQPGGWVSLRSWARDAGDSPVQQTLIRAFPVR